MKVLAKHPEEGAPNLLFLLFHGMGGDASQMAPLAQALHQAFPQAAVLSVEAPDAFDGIPGGGSGWQWFSEQGVTDHDRHEASDLIARFETEREKLVDLLRSAGDADLVKAAVHPRLGTPMKLVDLAYFVAEHDDHHLAQISRLGRLGAQ